MVAKPRKLVHFLFLLTKHIPYAKNCAELQGYRGGQDVAPAPEKFMVLWGELSEGKKKDRRKSGKLSKKEKAEDYKTEPVGFLEDNYFKPGCTTWHHLEDC